MKKLENKSIGERKLLQKIEALIEGDDRQKNTSSFLGFCSRLLGVKPKINEDFQSSLRQELFEKHSLNINRKEVDSRDMQESPLLYNFLDQLIMKNFKKVAFAGVPALALLFLVFTMVFTPNTQIANAMKIMENDPQVSSIIEQFNLEAQDVEIKGNMVYISLGKDDSSEFTVIVNLDRGIVAKMVPGSGTATLRDISNDENLLDSIRKMDATNEELPVTGSRTKSSDAKTTTSDIKDYLNQ